MSENNDSAHVEQEDAPTVSEDQVGGKKRKQSRCYTCGGEGHMARDCTRTKCHYCGHEGHIAKTCTMGSSEELSSVFILCQRQPEGMQQQPDSTRQVNSTPLRCFVRRFIIQLSSASPDFDVEDLTHGRVDVGCRCTTNALFRSQSLRHNTEIRLSFAGSKDINKKGQRKEASAPEEAVTVAVSGGLVRSLQPDEMHIASRLKSALCEHASHKVIGSPKPSSTPAKVHSQPEIPDGGAHLAQPPSEAGSQQEQQQQQQKGALSKQQLQQQEALRQKLSRGVRCHSGGLAASLLSSLTTSPNQGPSAEAGVAKEEGEKTQAEGDGVESRAEEGGDGGEKEEGKLDGEEKSKGAEEGRGSKAEGERGRRIVMELHPDGERIEECLRRVRAQCSAAEGGGAARLEQVLVVVGDNQGLTPADSEAVQRAASEGGAEYERVSLGSGMLLASQCIVLMNYFLDTLLHECPKRLWEAPGKEVVKRRKQTQKRRKKASE